MPPISLRLNSSQNDLGICNELTGCHLLDTTVTYLATHLRKHHMSPETLCLQLPWLYICVQSLAFPGEGFTLHLASFQAMRNAWIWYVPCTRSKQTTRVQHSCARTLQYWVGGSASDCHCVWHCPMQGTTRTLSEERQRYLASLANISLSNSLCAFRRGPTPYKGPADGQLTY